MFSIHKNVSLPVHRIPTAVLALWRWLGAVAKNTRATARAQRRRQTGTLSHGVHAATEPTPYITLQIELPFLVARSIASSLTPMSCNSLFSFSI